MRKQHLFFITVGFLLILGNTQAQTSQPASPDDLVFTLADQMPTFRKGTFEEFVVKNIEYPKDALERKIQGKVYVTFVVDEAGKVVDAKILKGIGYGCDEEALDMVNETSGRWNSGSHAGKKVKVRMNVPVVFKMGMPKGD